MLIAGALAAMLALPVAAGSTIVPQRGIGGVKLGMSPAKVRATLGKPRRIERGTNEFSRYTIFHYRHYRVSFQGNTRVTQIDTTSPKERTVKGVGVGSTRSALKGALRGVRCEGPVRSGRCWLGAYLPGRHVTDFFFRNGRVWRVGVGIVID